MIAVSIARSEHLRRPPPAARSTERRSRCDGLWRQPGRDVTALDQAPLEAGPVLDPVPDLLLGVDSRFHSRSVLHHVDRAWRPTQAKPRARRGPGFTHQRRGELQAQGEVLQREWGVTLDRELAQSGEQGEVGHPSII